MLIARHVGFALRFIESPLQCYLFVSGLLQLYLPCLETDSTPCVPALCGCSGHLASGSARGYLISYVYGLGNSVESLTKQLLFPK